MPRSRSTALLNALASAGAAVLLGLAAPATAQESITVAWYGGNWGDAFKACVADPFTKATGIRVTPEIGTSTVTLAKLQQQKNAPTIDAAWMDGGISELAQAAGVLDPLDPAQIRNLENVIPEAVYKADGTTFAVGTGYYSLGLVYNKDKVKQVPTSWADLWKPEFAEAVTIPAPANSSGVPFIFFLARTLGAAEGDLAPAFRRIKELKPALFFESSGAATNAYQTGEAVIGAHFNVGAWDLIDKGVPVGFVVPKEGVWATDARLHLVKGSPRKAAAEKFVDTALTPAAAACLAEKLYVGPAVRDVAVPPGVARKLPWGETGSVKSLLLFDWAVINRERARVVETWNREIARRN
jgi:putative spermidine/putrescine transport system substrate-binding protein